MPGDRLRHDKDDIENLDDIIEARSGGTSHFARDIDAAESDFDIPEDIDVDDALTFPHPKRKRNLNEDVELMSAPKKDDLDVGWQEHQEEMLPVDYKDDYDDALTTDLSDEDEIADDRIDRIGDIDAEDIIYETPLVTRMPKGFQTEEAASEEAATPRATLRRTEADEAEIYGDE